MDRLAQYVEVVRTVCSSFFARSSRAMLVGVPVLIFVLVGVGCLLIAPPKDFQENTTVHIVQGSSASDIAATLAEAEIVAYPAILKALLYVTGTGAEAQAGLYLFSKPENLITVAYRLIKGEYGIDPVRLIFIEGATLRDMGKQIEEVLPGVSLDSFLKAAAGEEGYLFPDTYLFQPGVDARMVVRTMRETFTKKTEPLQTRIEQSGRSLGEVVTLASIIEKEARGTVDQHLVSGILWNRIELGMRLQVDAVFGYIFNRPTYSPSPTDLKVDSPYNTYTHTGLPPGPIGNPGLAALEAAANPTETNYLYYITGNDGKMYYATTYAAHQSNIRKYLK